ncbi:MAG: hypothetical protein WEB50_14415, partial [Vicinamibacterales bacterium]
MTRLAVLLLSVFSAASPSTEHRIPSTGQAVVRFHHVHYRVGDPSAAISHAATGLKGERVIVQGIGVGVRAGDAYVIFDRLDETDPPSMEQIPVAEAYRAAVAWLDGHGVTAAPADAASQRLLAALPGERYDHVAFAAADLSRVAQQLSEAGVPAIRR